MASPTIWTPVSVDPVVLNPDIQTLVTAGAGGAILDHLLLLNSGPKDLAKMWDYDLSAVTYNDRTAAANSIAVADVTMGRTDIKTQPDYLYFSAATKFSSLSFILSTILAGATCTIEVAYGTVAGNPGTFTVMSSALVGLVDGTNVFKNLAGEIQFTIDPSLWATPWVTTTTGGATAGYFIRIGILTADPGTIMIGSQIRIGTFGACLATVYYVPSGGSASDSNVLAKNLVIPGDGSPVNVLESLMGRPFHMEPGGTIQAKANNPQVVCFPGGVDYA